MKMNECIKNLRIENNLTQKRLAEIITTSQDTISLWECGKGKPDNEMIIKMSILFDVSTDYILCVDDYKRYHKDFLKKIKKIY